MSTSNPKLTINDLSDEMLCNIHSFSFFKQKPTTLRLVSKKWNTLSQRNMPWSIGFERDFPKHVQNLATAIVDTVIDLAKDSIKEDFIQIAIPIGHGNTRMCNINLDHLSWLRKYQLGKILLLSDPRISLFRLFPTFSVLLSFIFPSQDISQSIYQSIKKIYIDNIENFNCKTIKIIALQFLNSKINIPALINALQGNTTIISLSLPGNNNNKLTLANISTLAELLKNNKTLTSLDLSNNNIIEDDVILLVNIIKNLTSLNLSQNHIDDDGTIKIATAITGNTNFTWLNLSDNLIHDAGAIAIATAITGNTNFIWLNISSNFINNEGAIAIAKALIGNTTFTWLNLSNNCINDEGAIAFAKILIRNKALTLLGLNSNQITNLGAIALANALTINTTLKSLTLSYNHINDNGAIAFATALIKNTALTSLSLYGNPITEAGARSLAHAVAYRKVHNLPNLTINTDNPNFNQLIAEEKRKLIAENNLRQLSPLSSCHF